MGTLTTDCPRLDQHCPHKLATSCRLTSTPNCCACADDRPHSRAYRIYIDGVGFVNHGTRWQNYCWYCKEFWTNRVAASDPPITPAQSRIPEHPDQTSFLTRWFEFHQGYSTADGEMISLKEYWEPLREVAPGFLPRTSEEVERGIPNDALRTLNRFQRAVLASETETANEGPQQSIEDALDELMRNEEEGEREGRGHGQEEASLEGQAGAWIRTYDSIGSGFTRAGTQGSERRDASTAAQSDSRRPEHEQQPQARASVESPSGPQRGRRRETHQQRLARVLGTREDVQRDDYVSPIANMYTRAWGRYQQAEQARALEPTTPPPPPPLPPQSPRQLQDPAAAFDRLLQRFTAELSHARAADPQPPQQQQESAAAFDTLLQNFASEFLNARAADSPPSTLDVALERTQELLLRLGTAMYSPMPLPPHAQRTHRDRTAFTQRVTSTLEEMLRERALHLRHLALQAGPDAGPQHELAFLDPAAGHEDGEDVQRRYRREIERVRTWLAELDGDLANNTTTPARIAERLAATTRNVSAPAPVPAPAPAPTPSSPFTPPAVPDALSNPLPSLYPPPSSLPSLSPPPNPLDAVDRPAPLDEADMTKTVMCKVCYEQVASMALLPCGHLVLCQWCSRTVVPMRHAHVPVAGAKCPLCRGMVKQVWRVHV